MKHKNNQLVKIATTAVFIALTCVLTMVVQIPSPTKGYMNLGDCAVLFSGYLLGPIYGPIAGGVGSALADFFAGYAIYVPGTLIIKALMAFVISIVPTFVLKINGKQPRLGFAVGAIISELIMVLGYYLYETIIIGQGFIAALAGVGGNIVQGIIGFIGSYFLIETLSHTNFFNLYGTHGFVKRKENYKIKRGKTYDICRQRSHNKTK